MFMEEVSAPTGKEFDLQQLFMEEMSGCSQGKSDKMLL